MLFNLFLYIFALTTSSYEPVQKMTYLKHFISTLFLIVIGYIPAYSSASEDAIALRYKNLAEQRLLMSKADNAADSLKYFLNIYDLSTNPERKVFADSLFRTAERAGDTHTQLEIIQGYSASKVSDEWRDTLLTWAMRLPASDKRDETVAFIKMRNITYSAYRSSASRLESELQTVINTLEHETPKNIYERIVERHRACVLLSLALRGDVLKEYYDQYLEDVENLPVETYSIRNAAYVQGCAIFNNSRDFVDAVKYNKKLLEAIESLEKRYKSHNRPFRNYNYNKYIRYVSLLKSYSVLSKEEINHIYAEILRLRDIDPEVKEIMENNPQAEAYYYFAIGDYKTALPKLLKFCEIDEYTQQKMMTLEMIIKSASNVGDSHALEKASEQYVDYVRKFIDDRSFETYRKLQIKMDISNIRQEKEQLKKDLDLQRLDTAKKMNTIFTVVSIVFFIIIVCLIILFIRNKKLNKTLKQTNLSLIKERDNLKKSQETIIRTKEEYENENKVKSSFIAGISHTLQPHISAVVENSRLIVDCADNINRPFLHKFANLVEQNVRIIQTIVKDVFTLTELHNSTISLHYNGVYVNSLCRNCVDTIKGITDNDVKVNFIEPEGSDDLIIITDAQRVSQVILHLLSNGIKFTEKGSVTLTYTLDSNKSMITFSVTDTGIGVPPSKADIIFERFTKLNRNESGLGIGLNIAKMIAEILHGNLRLDTSYNNGARFLFTIPTK